MSQFNLKINQIILAFSLFLLVCHASHAESLNKVHQQVIQKMKYDTQAFEEFKYLGQAHCVDVRAVAVQSQGDVFFQAHGSLFNRMYAFSRLMRFEKLKSHYHQYYQANHKNLSYQGFNMFDECKAMYSTVQAAEFYKKMVSDKTNYNSFDSDEDGSYNDEADMKSQMLFYLKHGKFDACRYTGCQKSN